jgi:hypothetical protein
MRSTCLRDLFGSLEVDANNFASVNLSECGLPLGIGPNPKRKSSAARFLCDM